MSTVVPPSGYFLANRFGRVFLASLEETVGRNGLNALLNLSGRESLITAPPPDDVQLTFDTATVSALLAVLELVYGPRGARGLAMRAGRAMFDRLVDGFELPTGFNPLAFRLLPQPTRLKIGVPALARLVTQHSDMAGRVADRGTYFEYTTERCADCWGGRARGRSVT